MIFTFICDMCSVLHRQQLPSLLSTRDEPRVRPKRVNIRPTLRDQFSAVADSGRPQCVQRMCGPRSAHMPGMIVPFTDLAGISPTSDFDKALRGSAVPRPALS
jgi:hypothetical protein